MPLGPGTRTEQDTRSAGQPRPPPAPVQPEKDADSPPSHEESHFFQHEAFLTARVPRVICSEHGVRQVQVPWARERSDFTLLFEALVMALVKEMPVKPIGELVGEHDTKIWRIVHHYVDQAVEAQDLSRSEERREGKRRR